MGSFDMSCAVSGMSIPYNSEAVVFFIAESGYREKGHCCYSTTKYEFLSLPIPMVYNDYGRYTVDPENPEWIHLIKTLNENGVYVPLGENKYHDIEVDPKSFTVDDAEKIFEAMHEGRLKIKHWNKDSLNVQPFPIKKDVYERAMLKPFTTWRDVTYTVEKYKEYLINKIREKTEERIKFHEEYFQKKHDEGVVDEKTLEGFQLRMQMLREDAENMSGVTSDDLELRELLAHCVCIPEYVENTDTDRAFTKISEMIVMGVHLDQCNIMVGPQKSGGQEINYKAVAEMHQELARIASEYQKRWDDEYDY